MNRVAILLISILVMQCGAHVNADVLSATMAFGSLEKKSDIIAVCEVLVLEESVVPAENASEGRAAGSNFRAECRILRPLKGIGSETITVDFILTFQLGVRLASFRKGEVAVLFLKQAGTGGYEFTTETCPCISLGQFAANVDNAEDSIRTRIAKQLFARMQRTDTDARDLVRAFEAVEKIGVSVPKRVLRSLSTAEDVRVRAVTLAYRIEMGDLSVVEKATALLLHNAGLQEQQISELAWAIEGSARYVSTGQANGLIASSNEVIKTVGLRILAVVGDKSSLPVLIDSLDHQNRQIRAESLRALKLVVKKQELSVEIKVADPDEEIEGWKEWWRIEKERSRN